MFELLTEQNGVCVWMEVGTQYLQLRQFHVPSPVPPTVQKVDQTCTILLPEPCQNSTSDREASECECVYVWVCVSECVRAMGEKTN